MKIRHMRIFMDFAWRVCLWLTIALGITLMLVCMAYAAAGYAHTAGYITQETLDTKFAPLPFYIVLGTLCTFIAMLSFVFISSCLKDFEEDDQ